METLRIKEILKLKGMTLNQLADKIGINRVNLSSSINGNPTLERLREIAEILEVEMSDLFTKPKIDEVTGYLEYDGTVYKITKLPELESLVKTIKNQINHVDNRVI